MKSIDEMKAEAFARWQQEYDLLHAQRKEQGLATIELVHADDEASTFTHAYQDEFQALKDQISAAGIEVEAPFLAVDSADAVSGHTGELIVSAALVTGIMIGFVAAWLQKKNGRKIILRFGDRVIEATTKEQLRWSRSKNSYSWLVRP